MYVTSLTENIWECRLIYHDQVISIRLEVNRALDPHWSLPNLSTRAVTSLLHPCILLYTILWNVNYTTFTWTLSDLPWLKALHVILAAILVGCLVCRCDICSNCNPNLGIVDLTPYFQISALKVLPYHGWNLCSKKGVQGKRYWHRPRPRLLVCMYVESVWNGT